MRIKTYLFLAFFVLIPLSLRAGDDFPTLKVVPWNGHKAATSLTFDDGDPSHLDVVLPELNRRGLKGTFFLIANRIERKDEWRQILPKGHEIGNHTLDHRHAAELSPQDEDSQVVGAHNVLQKEFGITVYTFAYPYTEVTPELEKSVEKDHLLARGGYGKSFVLTPDMDPDWMNIPSRGTETKLPYSTYQKWINECSTKGGWLVWRIHGLEGTPWGYEPISKKIFGQILDGLQAKDIWVGTFLEVGSYFRAQKIFEKAVVQKNGGEENISWNVPANFPPGVSLKLRLEPQKKAAPAVEVWQDGKKIQPDDKGLLLISFNSKSLKLHLSPKN